MMTKNVALVNRLCLLLGVLIGASAIHPLVEDVIGWITVAVVLGPIIFVLAREVLAEISFAAFMRDAATPPSTADVAAWLKTGKAPAVTLPTRPVWEVRPVDELPAKPGAADAPTQELEPPR